VRRALLAYSPVPQFQGQTWRANPLPTSVDPDLSEQPVPALSGNQPETNPSASEVLQNPLPSGKIPLLRLVGQIGAAYIVAEGPDGLYLIDQHAAHERVLFERFLKQSSGIIPSQSLLEPAVVNLPSTSAQMLNSQLPLLAHLGFMIEPFGADTFLVRAVPALLSSLDPAAALRVVVEDFEEDETPLRAEVEAKLIARVCKRAAVKAGQILSSEEQRSLLRDLEACQSPRTCPHGRPTMIHLSVDLLERQFGRKGAR
jgi:DNA mismatch repair protein MutL